MIVGFIVGGIFVPVQPEIAVAAEINESRS
jgi:hypothetical protein